MIALLPLHGTHRDTFLLEAVTGSKPGFSIATFRDHTIHNRIKANNECTVL